MAGAPGPPGITGLKVSKWGRPIFTSVQLLASVYVSGSDQSAILVLLSGHTCSFLGNYPSDFHWFTVKRRVVVPVFGERGGQGWWFHFLWDESAANEGVGTNAGWGQTGRLWQAEFSTELEGMIEMRKVRGKTMKVILWWWCNNCCFLF